MSKNIGRAVWFVGLPGSGKSTIARAVYEALHKQGVNVVHLEMDALRKTFFPNPTYDAEERRAAYAMFVQEGRKHAQQGALVLLDGTAAALHMRTKAREAFDQFAEVYIKCSLEAAIKRESARPQGKVMAELYHKALDRIKTGRQYTGLGQVVGVDVPFEENPNAELVLENDDISISQARDMVLNFLITRRFL